MLLLKEEHIHDIKAAANCLLNGIATLVAMRDNSLAAKSYQDYYKQAEHMVVKKNLRDYNINSF